MIAVRRIGVGQATDAARVHAAAFDGDDIWDAEVILRMLDAPGAFGLCAWTGGPQPTGLVLARAIAGESEILTLAVDRRARRRGVGRALMDGARAEARARAATAMFLEVAADNAAASALYAGLGFREVGRRRGYYSRPGAPSIDAAVLRADISGA